MRPSGSKDCSHGWTAAARGARVRQRAFVAGTILACCATLLAGCIDSLPYSALPSLGKDNRPIMTAEQQKATAAEIEAKKAVERAEALKKIEGSK